MTQLSKPLLRAVFNAVPGVLDLHVGGVSTPDFVNVSSIEVTAELKGNLAFASLNLVGVPLTDLAAAQIESSPTGSAAAPTLAGFSSVRARRPFWRIKFAEPQPTVRVLLTGARGQRSTNPARITFTATSPDGVATTFSAGAAEQVLAQIDRFRSAWTTFSSSNLSLSNLGLAAAAGLEFAVRMREAPPAGTPDRASLIAAVVETISSEDPETLRGQIAAAAAILPWLIDCRTERKTGEVAPTDLQALAVLLTNRVLRKGSARRRILRSYEALLPGSTEHVDVEMAVGGLYQAAGGDPSVEPILFRKHGLSGSSLLKHSEVFLDAMKWVESTLREVGYDACLHYGTLLGAVREKTFIPHDDDVDMAMMMRAGRPDEILAEASAAVDALRERGARARVIICDGLPLLKVMPPASPVAIDVFGMIEAKSGGVLMLMEALRAREIRKALVLPFANIPFYGRTFRAPAQSEKVLEERYGADWRVPRRWVSRNTALDAA